MATKVNKTSPAAITVAKGAARPKSVEPSVGKRLKRAYAAMDSNVDVPAARVLPEAAAEPEAAEVPLTLEEQILNVLKKHLRISIETGGFTSPNDRLVKVKLGKEVVCETSFCVRQQREYEG